MNWIIKDTEKLYCHTNLNNLLNSSWVDIFDFDWVMSDLDVINYSKKKLPIDFRNNYTILSPENFKTIIESDLQVIWGVISAIKKSDSPKFNDKNFPYVDGNSEVCKNNLFLIENSAFEITAWDSSYTIVKFKDKELSGKFKTYFEEAIELDKCNF